MNDPATLDSPTAPAPDAHTLGALEGRVHRLEEAVAPLQDTHVLEERILERLRGAPQAKVGPLPPDADKVTATPPAPAPPAPEAPPWSPWPAPPPRLSGLAEFRAMVRMFFDIHYHVAWTTRFFTLLIVGLIATS